MTYTRGKQRWKALVFFSCPSRVVFCSDQQRVGAFKIIKGCTVVAKIWVVCNQRQAVTTGGDG